MKIQQINVSNSDKYIYKNPQHTVEQQIFVCRKCSQISQISQISENNDIVMCQAHPALVKRV